MSPGETPSEPLRIAFVGAGQMARLHLAALRRVVTPHSVVGVFDANPDARREFAALAGAVSYDSYHDLLQDGRPDVVHVCTPAGTHFAPARAALEAGAHVYVEKPIVEAVAELDELLALARERGLVVCAGHQVAHEPAFDALVRQANDLAPIAAVDSTFAFHPMGLRFDRASPAAFARQLLDILPHPLYLLVLALERLTPKPSDITVEAVSAGAADVHAVLRGDGVFGRLAVTLRGRPVASTLTISGMGGSLTADFIRGCIIGAGNPGTGPLEKLLNPVVEGVQTIVRSSVGIARRLLNGGDYPGLAELIGACYAAATGAGPAPHSPEHLRRVVAIYEQLRDRVMQAATTAGARRVTSPVRPQAPVVVLTGARGFLGREVARQLARRGYRVRGLTRGQPADDCPDVHEWVRVDLAVGCDPAVFAGAEVVVHAAAETAGGFEAHQRNSINATRNLLQALAASGVRRLVYVSTISVLRPPRWPWERQDEATPRPREARHYGAYTWGKTEAERVVDEEAGPLGLETRIVRPGALVDWNAPEIPGLAGRRLFGTWHLGLGRPSLPIAVCDVRRAAGAIAWCAERFVEAPVMVNLLDPAVQTRGELLTRFRRRGWRGRMVWVPIPLMVALLHTARTLMALLHGGLPERLGAWAVLRPRRYRTTVAEGVLREAAQRPPEPSLAPQLHP